MELLNDDVRSKLKTFGFLQDVGDDIFGRLAQYSVVLRYAAGDYVWFEGMPANLLAVVWSGRLELRVDRQAEPLGSVGAGQIVGAEAVTGSANYETTAVCVEPAIVVVTPLRLVADCMHTDAPLTRNLAAALAQARFGPARPSSEA